MGTATSRLAWLALTALVLAGCGGAGAGGRRASPSRPAGESSVALPRSPRAHAFAWLHAQPFPRRWTVVHIHSGAAMAYPPGWKPIQSDPGTATAATFDRRDHIAGYLNLTPRQGAETLSGWARFRVGHNADEDDRDVTILADASRLSFRSARGSCVMDAYTTTARTQYVELACLVRAARSAVVIVGAAPPQQWRRVAPVIERAISSVIA